MIWGNFEICLYAFCLFLSIGLGAWNMLNLSGENVNITYLRCDTLKRAGVQTLNLLGTNLFCPEIKEKLKTCLTWVRNTPFFNQRNEMLFVH